MLLRPIRQELGFRPGRASLGDLLHVGQLCGLRGGCTALCGLWRGLLHRSHWGIADPAAVRGADTECSLAFAEAARLLGNRIRLFSSLPLDKLDGLSIKRRMDEIGVTQDASQAA